MNKAETELKKSIEAIEQAIWEGGIKNISDWQWVDFRVAFREWKNDRIRYDDAINTMSEKIKIILKGIQ